MANGVGAMTKLEYLETHHGTALALARRLHDDLQRIPAEAGNRIYSPEVSQDELELVRIAFGTMHQGGDQSAAFAFTDIWTRPGLVFLAAVVYAKYASVHEEGFWDGLSAWAFGDIISSVNVCDYDSLKTFMHKHSLYLFRRTVRNFYVTSLYTHAILAAKHVHRVALVLARTVEQTAFFVDDTELDEILHELVDESAGYYSDTDALDDDEELDDIHSSARFTSLILRLPSSFKRACVYSTESAMNVIRPLYRAVEDLVLSRSPADTDMLEHRFPHHMRNGLQLVANHLAESARIVARLTKTRSVRSRRFRRPVFIFDFERKELSLVIPPQRIDSEADQVDFSLRETDGVELFQGFVTVDHYGSDLHFTAETVIDINQFRPNLKIFIHHPEESKEFDLSQEFLIVDYHGDPFPLPIPPGQDSYLIVPHTANFRCNNATLFCDCSDKGFIVHHIHLVESTVFSLNGTLIAPCRSRVPDLVLQAPSVDGAKIHRKTESSEVYQIFKEFPDISFRAGDIDNLHENFKLIVNGVKREFTEIEYESIPDGTNEIFVTVRLETDSDRDSNRLLNVSFKGIHGNSMQIVVLPEFDFKFDKPVYAVGDNPRVQSLSFVNDEHHFLGNYSFPMLPGVTSFRLDLFGDETTLVLEPPTVKWSLVAGDPVPLHCEVGDLSNTELLLTHSLRSVVVQLVPNTTPTDAIPLRPKSREGNVVRIPLATLRNHQEGSAKLVVLVRPTESDSELLEYSISTIHAGFAFVDGPKCTANDWAGILAKMFKEGLGLYLIYTAIGRPRSVYEVKVSDTGKGGTENVVPLIVNGENQKMKVSENTKNRRLRIEVFESVKRMGSVSAEVTRVYDEFWNGESILQDSDGLVGRILKCTNLCMAVIGRTGNRIERTQISNFFVEIKSKIDDPESDTYQGDGFFMLNGSSIWHTHFNPYTIRVTKNEDSLLRVRIADRDGKSISIDDYGLVNRHNSTPVVKGHSLEAIIIREDDIS